MKVISITMVKNEEEIIESFIRYNMNFLYKMVIIDNGSTDSTIKIIQNIIGEGYNISLFDQSRTNYEQFLIENKYLKLVAEKYESDIIIPLDADEFIIAQNDIKSEFQKLSFDFVYNIKWKNYVMDLSDDSNENFIPKRITHVMKKGHISDAGTKVIIPTSLARSNNIIMNTGHHSVKKNEKIKEKNLNTIMLAHFPVISQAQIESKLYTREVGFINWLNRGTGTHTNRMYNYLVEDKKDVVWLSQAYGATREELLSIEFGNTIESPIDLQECTNIQIKYSSLIQKNPLMKIVEMAKCLAIKNYNLERKIREKKECPIILVFGTGSSASSLLEGLDEDIVNIRAYIDSDIEREYTYFQRRLVISPEKIKFMEYDKIVIASVYYDEIRSRMLKIGIEKEKIVGKEYLVKLALNTI